ncbi:unknown [Firmicutes bacterium CAG:460]|jgi:hypothetical protein|uniref:hypothetical protein n=1 Tax=Candidatus Onthocola sp. TaxID=3085646 RepID=UPI00033FBB29|nr:unknown [Firmicutes bacterium CAG:460]
MEQIINYNDAILKNYQKTYPNLAEFTYDVTTDALVYEGNYVKLNGYGLSRIDPIFFNMMPEDIFIYMKNGFYQNAQEDKQINEYLSQFVITEEEIGFINSYVERYIERLNIYARNRDVFDKYLSNDSIKDFMESIRNAKKIIDFAKNNAKENNSSVYSMLRNAYDKEMASMNQNNEQEKTIDKTLSLSRTNSKFSGFSEFEKNEQYLKELNDRSKLSVAGYTSILLIIATTISVGMYLAIQLFLK